jgi:hypothetical protein
MAKPTRIKHSGLGIYLNDKQADRVQTFGSSTGLNPEELKEIGNINVVEVIDGIPTVDITLDCNQYGSIKTIAQLANKNFNYGYPQVSPSGGMFVDVSTGDFFINERKFTKAVVSTVDCTPGKATTANHWKISEISIDSTGAPTLTSATEFDPTVSEPPVYPTTPVGNLKLAEIYLPRTITTVNDDHILNIHDSLTIDIADFEYSNVDVVVPVKEVGDNTTTDPITRTMYVENCFCNKVDMSFNTDGLSTENFSCESDNKKWFLNSARTVVVDRLIRQAPSMGVASYTLTQTPTQLANLNYTLKCRIYDPVASTYTELVEGTDYTVAGTAVSVTSGNPTEVTAVLIFRYCANINEDTSFTMLPNPKDSHPDPPGGLKQGQIEIYMTDDANDFILRIESATVTADLTREALNEIGHALPYDRPMKFPIPVTVTLNTKASDLEEFARMIGKKAEFDADTIAEMDINDFSKNLGLRIYMYREPDTKRDETPFMFQPYLKYIVIDNLAITDEGFDIAVDSDATQKFSLKADNMTITARI